MTTDFLTIEDVAARLKLSVKTLKRLKRAEGFPLRRVTPRGTMFVFWSEVDRWLKKRTSPSFR